eukprot:CAMPEP_0118889942 /NCGR_PEP_ID=MMETSP1166-20130328/640_1 /TAXON_ID=1104430 /ORGANISM="Chrysoreinhardia sp, Strain CCMP3193" /LENGTH=43 /DNA_ID= /DNA_START= /DNA_END= /DNA_ORIENTATION=
MATGSPGRDLRIKRVRVPRARYVSVTLAKIKTTSESPDWDSNP